MRDSVMWFLISSLVLTSLFVVHVRHQHRINYSAFQAGEDRRDSLNDEWGQLLIEENTWAFPHRIEKDASQFLAMRAPKPEEVHFVGLDKTTLSDLETGDDRASR